MKIIINGIGGKVGNMLLDTLSNIKDAEIVCGIDKFANPSEYKVPIFNSFDDCNYDADVIIDFSRPEALYSILKYAKAKKINIVLATTGYSEEEQELIKESSKDIAIFQTSNMSLGVNLLAEISKQAAKFLGSAFDIEIIEQHHKMKVDSPSGTAIYIANEINKVFDNNKEYIYGRHSKHDKRETSHIGMHAIRGGTIVGKHEVMFIGTDEVVTLSHDAQSRKVFALGSIRAAQYINEKSTGMYSMDNILGKDYAVTSISSTSETTLITIPSITSKNFSKLLSNLADANINLDMISRIMNNSKTNTVSFTLPDSLNKEAYKILTRLNIEYDKREGVGKLLISGAGMVHECGVAEEVFTLLDNYDTDIYAVTTSETEISCCIDSHKRKLSEKLLRDHYGIGM